MRKNEAGRGNGAQGRNRTTDTAIFSRMLYQLSYLGVPRKGRKPSEPAGYRGPKPRCLPRFASGPASSGPARGEGRGAPGAIHKYFRNNAYSWSSSLSEAGMT